MDLVDLLDLGRVLHKNITGVVMLVGSFVIGFLK